MFLNSHTLMWIILFTPVNCLRSYDGENKKFTTSTDMLEHDHGNTLKSSNNDWTKKRSSEQIRKRNESKPIIALAADQTKESPAAVIKRGKIQKNTEISALQIIKRHSIKERDVDGSNIKKKKKKTKSGKTPPQNGKGRYDMKLRPSVHTIVACITAMMVVFHIIICLSVWQQCKNHNSRRVLGATLPMDAPPPRPRPRHNGEQSFSDMVEEPPLIGEVPLPPEYKEGEASKPPSYDNIMAPNRDHTRAV